MVVFKILYQKYFFKIKMKVLAWQHIFYFIDSTGIRSRVLLICGKILETTMFLKKS